MHMKHICKHQKDAKPWRLFCWLAFACSVPGTAVFQVTMSDAAVLFRTGDAGYACFRIPALVAVGGSDLVVFAEGRKNGCDDFGDVDVVMRRSEDGGATWLPIEVVVDQGVMQAGNSAPVWDTHDPEHPDGKLLLLYNTGTASEWDVRSGRGRREAWCIESPDGGRSWGSPRNITQFIHFDAWSDFPEADERTLAFTPGHAIQLHQYPHTGRLVVAANHSAGPPQAQFEDYRSFAIYSDDHGVTWQRSQDVGVPASNEATAVELSDGRVMLNIRMQDGRVRRRLVAVSEDGGMSWPKTVVDEALVSPVCQGSVLGIDGGGIVYSGPNDENDRINVSIWLDEGRGAGWNPPVLVNPGFGAYSDMAQLRPNQIGIAYEANDYREIQFRIANW